MISFTECARVNVATDPHFITVCNRAASKKPLEHVIDGELLEDLLESDSWLSYFGRRFQRLVRPVYDGL